MKGKAAAVVPLNVIETPGAIAPYAQVTVGTLGPYVFLVDSGDPTSALATTLMGVLDIHPMAQTVPAVGVGCSQPNPLVPGATPMALGSTSLAVTSPHALTYPGLKRSGTQGSLGLDGLGSFKSIVLDYRGADLALGTG